MVNDRRRPVAPRRPSTVQNTCIGLLSLMVITVVLCMPMNSAVSLTPSEPTDVDARTDNGHITVVWGPPSVMSDDVMGYYILRGGEEIADVGPSSRMFLDTEADSSQSWTYSVIAYTAVGNGSVGTAVYEPEEDQMQWPLIIVSVTAALILLFILRRRF